MQGIKEIKEIKEMQGDKGDKRDKRDKGDKRDAEVTIKSFIGNMLFIEKMFGLWLIIVA